MEAVWELEALEPADRFRKLQRGKWEAVFVRRRKRSRAVKPAAADSGLLKSLTDRGVLAGTARKLVRECSKQRIEEATRLFDWYQAKRQVRGAGFLVSAIRSEEEFVPPKGFASDTQRPERKRAPNARKRRKEKIIEERATRRSVQEKHAERAFSAFWEKLDGPKQATFEASALRAADPT